ncbi:MAG: PD-(D/E)XK nuclease-like domain-containing protein [Lachnospira sp.]
MLVGSYVDSYFEGSLEQFKKENKEIFTQKGDLKSDYQAGGKHHRTYRERRILHEVYERSEAGHYDRRAVRDKVED